MVHLVDGRLRVSAAAPASSLLSLLLLGGGGGRAGDHVRLRPGAAASRVLLEVGGRSGDPQ